MRAVAFLLLAAVASAGCSGPGAANTETVHGPTDQGQVFRINVQNDRRSDVIFTFELPRHEPFSFTLPASPSVPNVATAYQGSLPPGSSFTVREGAVEKVVTLQPGFHWVDVDAWERDGQRGFEVGQFTEEPFYD